MYMYNWVSLIAQLVKNPPAMWEAWVQSLGGEDSLEKGKATHSSVLGLPWWGLAGKESTCWYGRWEFNLGDLSSIPGLWKSPGEGKGNPLQDSGLENSMDCIVPGVTKSQTRLSDFHFHCLNQFAIHLKLAQHCKSTIVCVSASVLFDSLWPRGLYPGCSVHRILQARILEWVAIPFSKGSSQSRDQTCVCYVSCIGRRVLYHYCHLGSPNWYWQLK